MSTLIILIVLAAVIFAIYRAYTAAQEESKVSKEVRTIRSLPPSIQHVVSRMDGRSQAALFNEYEQKKKKISVGYILWFIFGFHYLYYSKVGIQFLFWFTGAGLGSWALVDLFRMPSIARSANEQIARQALQALQTLGIAAFATPQQFPGASSTGHESR
jgi:hypothetical protein